MSITNKVSGTSVHEIAEGIFRINTPVTFDGGIGGFSFNQYLIVDEEPLLFHTGPRKMFPLVSEAVDTIIPADSLRYISFSHFESDECGSLNEWLAVAPQAVPLCGGIAAMVSINDIADRAPRAMGDGEALSIGSHKLRWLDAPHLPHGWECGYIMEERTGTLLCGDLFTQPGAKHPPLTESDVLGPSEEFRLELDYYSHTKYGPEIFEKLASFAPKTLACMHGSAWQGDGAGLLRALSSSIFRIQEE
jgi:flavorubredoxin